MTDWVEVGKEREWRHRFSFMDTSWPAYETARPIDGEIQKLGLPKSLADESVLDVGCSDGGFTFACERRGATMLLGIDSQETINRGGNNCFEVAAHILGSSATYTKASLDEFFDTEDRPGDFDRILYLDVLYHVRDPLGQLERLHELLRPGGTVHVKTRAHSILPARLHHRAPNSWGLQARPTLEFIHGDFQGDPTCWFFPSASAVVDMLRATGFEAIEVTGRYNDRLFVTARRSAKA